MRVAAVVAGSVSTLVVNTLPAITGVLARQLGIPPKALGAYASADVLGITAGGLVALPLMRAFSPRAAAVLGLASLAVADAASAAFPNAEVLITLRAAGGLGTGLLLAASFYVYALLERERNFAAFTLGQTALALLLMALIPPLAKALGWQAPFVALAILTVPGLLLVRHFPAHALRATSSVRAPHGPANAPLTMAIVSIVVFFLGQGGLWTYLERIGAEAGFSEQLISTSLSICAAGGFVSSAAVLAIGERVTSGSVLAGSLLLNLLAALAVASRLPWVYAGAITLFYVSLPFMATSQFGALTRLPGGQRAAVLASTATYAGFTLGPITGGYIAERFGYAAVRWLDIVLVSLAALLLVPALVRSRQERPSAPGAERQGA